MVQERARQLIADAVKERISDLYFLPKDTHFELYLRKNDERRFEGEFPYDEMQAIVGHFKFVSGMNVGEKRRSQLGSCNYDYGEGTISLRLSTVGDYKGHESMVIRLIYDLDSDLSFWFESVRKLADDVKGRGLYLFSGPVGSGKTSLMYHLARQRFQGQQVITIEDPVEIKQEDMLQLQLNETIGSTYDELIKLSLRHRPDLLIIGEIRDSQTARAVMRASLTGATVFSTIHAKSISGVYDRLIELGVSPEELKNSLQGIYYQRLLAGGGVVDFANQNFEKYQPTKWNQQIDQLFAAGHLSERQWQSEKIKTA
ncbi:competence type IV pilus ATPase ComGA [Streptococcus merionis]|uniref:Type II secretory pathway, ATPase PulE/Tfp pilus assembly pathway, ATPase PilB n=1 Tax=Streptococcus merionis TaxID=400065 RepID=A0A239T0F0_9STRE|nr:competence type IV pilus ATPase ComGA [Streptococcus merionis]SNU91200.1 Type II secretory pathway, ATPase PulE/Tfp pilus assembly pathway, ATPase PilB [Streptococcus merionis]